MSETSWQMHEKTMQRILFLNPLYQHQICQQIQPKHAIKGSDFPLCLYHFCNSLTTFLPGWKAGRSILFIASLVTLFLRTISIYSSSVTCLFASDSTMSASDLKNMEGSQHIHFLTPSIPYSRKFLRGLIFVVFVDNQLIANLNPWNKHGFTVYNGDDYSHLQ